MSVKFFGQFLIEAGDIDAGQICDALVLMKRENKALGAIGVERGTLSPTAVSRIHAEQRRRDRPFGELAIERGHLSAKQLEELVRIQADARLRLGEALVRLGYLTGTDLGARLDEFKLDQATHTAGSVPLGAELAGSRLANLMLDLVPRFCLRLTGERVKVAPARSLRELIDLRYWARISVRGPGGLVISLGADRGFGAALAAPMAGCKPYSLDEGMIRDGLGEFLNILVGNAIAALEREGTASDPLPVDPNPRAPEAGTLFPLVVPDGRGVVVLDRD